METELTAEQKLALDEMLAFIADGDRDAFILQGGAGTGKSTLIAHLVSTLQARNISVTVLAPTGRAARVVTEKFEQHGVDAQGRTIHSQVFVMAGAHVNEEAQTSNDPGVRFVFPIKQDEPTHKVYVVDEASMVGDQKTFNDEVRFGTGRLLSDLVTHLRLGRPGRAGEEPRKLVFVGDPAQLPPVGDPISPALSESYLRENFNLRTASFSLTRVMRQAQGSAILDRATEVRENLLANRFNTLSLRPNQEDIVHVDTVRAVDEMVRHRGDGRATIMVVPTNALALEYNRSVRERLWGDPDTAVRETEPLLVNRNSHLHKLMNGDIVEVVEVAGPRETVSIAIKDKEGSERVQLHFRDLVVRYTAWNGESTKRHAMILENLLQAREREPTPRETRALLVHFRQRFPMLKPNTPEFSQALKNDLYFNALQVKFGYSLTCHKAQGGEWANAIVDFGGRAGRNEQAFRWTYTAITRAKKRLFVVNPPAFSPTSSMQWTTPAAKGTGGARLPPLEELAADPDWNRFSFSPAIAPLMLVHQRLRDVWDAQGIRIESLRHLQYCERYALARGEERAQVQYFYNGRNELTRSSEVPGPGTAPALVQDALVSLDAIARGSADDVRDTASDDPEFIRTFLAQLDQALSETGIRRLTHTLKPYRLRVRLSDGNRTGEIDFVYNGKEAWTSAVEVGGPGKTAGLYDEVQHRLSASNEVAS